MQSTKAHTHFTALRQYWKFHKGQTASGYMSVVFISIDPRPFMALTLDNADPLFGLVMAPGFPLHHEED